MYLSICFLFASSTSGQKFVYQFVSLTSGLKATIALFQFFICAVGFFCFIL